MSFQSLHFFLFLALVFGLNRWLLERLPWRKSMLLAASYYFYMCWDWRFLGLVLLMTLVNYIAGRRIAASATSSGKRAWLMVAVAACIGTLAYFKYEAFLVTQTAGLLNAAGFRADSAMLRVVLPIGISFYTFQSLSYTLDIYRGASQPTSSLRDFALFVAFFPTVLSGPITRSRQLLPQFERPLADSLGRAEEGIVLMVRGFVKKIAFADVLAVHLVDPAFAAPGEYAPAFLLVALYAYTFQIYMDLSGYTDIARGAAKLLGFELPENFNRPYRATSISSFWQRWHISMSSFFRDYLFFGLGGSRHGNVYFNLYVTFLAIGLWHGLGMNFVLYGTIHGAAVMIERWRRVRAHGRERRATPMAAFAAAVITLHVVVFSRILFRSSDLTSAFDYLAALCTNRNGAAPFNAFGIAVLVTAFVLHYLPQSAFGSAMMLYGRLRTSFQGALLAAVVLGLLALSTYRAPFVYFQF